MTIRVLIAICVLLVSSTAYAQLSESERRGKGIYLRGESPSGRKIAAMLGDLDVPSSTMTCGGCHGLRGEGKTEGGVTAGSLTWSNLLKPYGHTHPNGRKHGAFDEKLFIQSLTLGTDPSGNELAKAMPRFEMAPEDIADLIAYLKRIETDRDPGLTESSIKVGTILPQNGALAEIGAVMKDVLTAYFANVNDKGGIYNRRIELQTIDAGADGATTAANVKTRVQNGDLFALVSGVSAGADKELAALTRDAEIPFVGAATLLTQASAQNNRNLFYVLPGATQQARALVDFAAKKPELKKSPLAIVYGEDELDLAAAAAIEDEARKLGWTSVVKKSFVTGRFDATATVASLKADNVATVFFLGAGGETNFIDAASAASWTPHVLLLGALTGRDLVKTLPPGFNDRVFLAFPTVPSDVGPEGLAELRSLEEKYKLRPGHTASKLNAFAAAKIFTEALKRAGRDLSREKLITSLEGLYEYDTGVTPNITFGPNRRIGSLGSYVVSADLTKREFVLISNK